MHDGHHDHPPPHGPGHNARDTAQWQTPHLPNGGADKTHHAAEPDLDLVENAFVEAFPRAPDPTSFLRLAGIPFVGKDAEGRELSLLRVEVNHAVDVGAVTPHVGGGSHRYDPLPAKMTSRRQSLAFVYFDGTGPVRLSFTEAVALAKPQDSPPRV